MKFGAFRYMNAIIGSLLFSVWLIACGHSTIGGSVAIKPIKEAETFTLPISTPDTPKVMPIQSLSAVEATKLATAQKTLPRTNDTLLRKVSNAMVDMVYWSHNRSIKKDSQIMALTSKVDELNGNVKALTGAVQKQQTEKKVATATIGMFDAILNYCGYITLIFVLAHYITYLYRTRKKAILQ